MDRLTGQDAQFLYNETPAQHMHTLKIAVADVTDTVGGYSYDRFRQVVAERVHVLPELRRRVAWAPLRLGHPWWVDDPDFDLDRHLHRATVAAPGDRAALDAVISEVAATALPADRPLWGIWVAEGLADRKVAFITKIHHAVADGARAAEMLAAMTSTDPAAVDPPPATPGWSPAPLPTFAQRLRTGLGIVVDITARLPGLLVRTLVALRALVAHRRQGGPKPAVPFTGARLAFNRALTPRRTVVTTSMPLDSLKQAKASLGVTLNDIVLALVTGGMRRYLDGRGQVPDRGLVAGVPVSTRTGEGQGANRVSNLFVDLPVHVADPHQRLRLIHDSAEGAKAQFQVLGTDMLADWSELTPAQPYRAFMRWYSGRDVADRGPSPLNLVVSNVPGPREPLFIAGARIVELYSVGPILEGIGLNVTVWSYTDRLYAAILGCPDHQDDLRRLAEAIPEALDELAPATSAPSP